MNLMPYTFTQYFDSNGDPLNGCKVYTYEPGTTNNRATYTAADGATPNANPVIGDSDGRVTIFGSGIYDFAIYDSDDNLIDTKDSVNLSSDSSLITSKLTLGTGWIDASTALSNPDDISTYSRVTVNPQASADYYNLTEWEDGRPVYIQNLSSSDGANIEVPNSGSFTVPAYEMVIAMYDSDEQVVTICNS